MEFSAALLENWVDIVGAKRWLHMSSEGHYWFAEN